MLEALQESTKFFQDFKGVWVTIYILGLVFGLFLSSYTDILFFRIFRKFDIKSQIREKLKKFFALIWLPIFFVVAGMFLVFLASPVSTVGSPNFMIRAIIVGVILVNGILFYLIIGRKLLSPEHLKGETESSRDLLRKLSFAFASISFASWYSLLISSLIYQLSIGFETLTLVYAGVVAVGVLVGQFYEFFFVKDSL